MNARNSTGTKHRLAFGNRHRPVLYQRIPKLFADLALARGDGRYARLLRALGGVQLLNPR